MACKVMGEWGRRRIERWSGRRGEERIAYKICIGGRGAGGFHIRRHQRDRVYRYQRQQTLVYREFAGSVTVLEAEREGHVPERVG